MIDLDVETTTITERDGIEYVGPAITLLDQRDGDVIRHMTPDEATDLANRLLAAVAEVQPEPEYVPCKDCHNNEHGEPVEAPDGYCDGLGYCPCCRVGVTYDASTNKWIACGH